MEMFIAKFAQKSPFELRTWRALVALQDFQSHSGIRTQSVEDLKINGKQVKAGKYKKYAFGSPTERREKGKWDEDFSVGRLLIHSWCRRKRKWVIMSNF